VFCLHFSFSENCFHFQKIRILKTCLVWLLIFYFQEIKILKFFYILTSCLVFLELLKITFLTTAFSFYPKWGSCFQLKILKMRFYCFYFLVRLEKYFHWKCFQKSNQMHFHHHFLISVKMKTGNNQTKHPLSFFFSFFVFGSLS